MTAAEQARMDAFRSGQADFTRLPRNLGAQAEWRATAVAYLRQASAGRTDGTARVSIAAIGLALAQGNATDAGQIGVEA